MLKSLNTAILIIFLGLPFYMIAQVSDNNIPKYSERSSIYNKERKLIEDAFKLANSNESKKAYTTAHYLLKTVKTDYAKANSNLLLAYYFNDRALIDSSIFYTNNVLKYSQRNNDSISIRGRILSYYLLAVNYDNKGLFEESKKWYLKGIQRCDDFNEKNLYYRHTHGLALAYTEMGNDEQAIALFKKCIEHSEDLEILYGSYINLGYIYGKLGDINTSNTYLEKGKLFSEQNNNYQAQAVITLNLGSNYQDQGNIEKALSLFQETSEIADKWEYKKIAIEARINIGKVFFNLKKYQDAELVYSLALTDAIELGYLNQQLIIYDALRKLAVAQKNYKNAFDFVSKYFNVKDSISNLQKVKEINELEIKYQTLQKVKEIKLLQVENSNRNLELTNQQEAIKNLRLQQEIEKKENENNLLEIKNTTERIQKDNIILKKDSELQQIETKRQKSIKNTILYSFLILLIPVIALLLIYYQKIQAQSELNKKQEEIKEQEIASLIKDQELKVIKASIKAQDKERKRIAQELHDSIGGNLAAIKLQLNNSDKKQTNELKTINLQIDETYEQVRSLSHNLIPKKFSTNNFCDVLEDYFKNIGNTDQFNTSFIAHPKVEIDTIDEALQIEIFKITQELITNTIKHANATVVEFQINMIDNTINILFEDNGVGFEIKNTKDGIGFRNIRSRLKKMSGTLDIDSRVKRGTLINIEIPNLINTHNV